MISTTCLAYLNSFCTFFGLNGSGHDDNSKYNDEINGGTFHAIKLYKNIKYYNPKLQTI